LVPHRLDGGDRARWSAGRARNV